MKYFLLLSFIALLFTNCSSTRIIKEETAAGIDIAAYKTFNYYSLQAAGDTTPRKSDLRMSQVKKAISDELKHKGYQFAVDNPDFLVNLSMNVKQDVQTREKNLMTDAPAYVGQKNYTWKADDVVVGYYKTGTMEVDIVDARDKTLVWQSISEGVLADKESDIEKRMQDRFKKVFENFPNCRK